MFATAMPTSECAQESPSPVIVLAAFGSSKETGLSNLDALDQMVRAQFQGYDVRWAFTSGVIVKKLGQAGIDTVFASRMPVKSLGQVYADLGKEKKTNVVVQCILVMEGAEMRQVLLCDPSGLNVRYGCPLLCGPGGIHNTVHALSAEFGGQNTATIICAHGNGKHPEYNAALAEMDEYVRAHYGNAFVATVEGPPGTEAAIAAVKASGASAVRFVPLMLTEGEHIQNDVLGDGLDSWKVLLGLPATCASGMASNPDIARLFTASIARLVAQF